MKTARTTLPVDKGLMTRISVFAEDKGTETSRNGFSQIIVKTPEVKKEK